MKKLNKILSFMFVVCLVIPCAFFMFGCKDKDKETIKVLDAGDRIENSSIYAWDTYSSGDYTCAAVQIDFDKVNIEDIRGIKVEMFVGDVKTGTATCTGDQILFYWENYGIYWTDAEGNHLTAQNWQDCAGKQWLECYFTPTTEVRNEEDWTMEYTGEAFVAVTSFKFELVVEENNETITYTYEHVAV